MFVLMLLLLYPLIAQSQSSLPALLPYPQKIEWLRQQTSIAKVMVENSTNTTFVEELLRKTGCNIAPSAPVKITISLKDSIAGVSVNQQEAYKLTVGKSIITIEACTETGIYYALQTMRQLTTRKKGNPQVQCCKILDWPAFSVRGFMHDTGRGYLSVD